MIEKLLPVGESRESSKRVFPQEEASIVRKVIPTGLLIRMKHRTGSPYGEKSWKHQSRVISIDCGTHWQRYLSNNGGGE